MKKKKQKKNILGIILVSFLTLYAGYVLIDQQKIILDKDKRLKDIQAKIQQEEQLANELQKKKEIVGTDSYVEEVARDKLGMVKRDEKVYIDAGR